MVRCLRIVAVLTLAWSVVTPQVHGQSPSFTKNNSAIVQIFHDVISKSRESVVRVQSRGKDVAYGVVVRGDGMILTKASEAKVEVTCKLADERVLPATIVGTDENYDLALLKVDATELPVVEWMVDNKAASVGRWVASVGTGSDPAALGIISVAARKLKQGDQPPKNFQTNAGYLGVQLEPGEGGAKIAVVSKGSPAETAKLQVNDIVTHVNMAKVIDTESLINTIGSYKPGDEVTIKIKREMEGMEIKVKLGKRPPQLFGMNPQEQMGSTLSNRRGGFPVIVQHDSVIKPSDCGGPLVNLDGQVIGINISRAGRTESFAIPSEAVVSVLPYLFEGKSAPVEKQK